MIKIHSQQLICLLMLLCIPSCSHYEPAPLTEGIVEESLKPPDMLSMLIWGENICHPALKPIKVRGMHGLTPNQAAVLAVFANPSLQAERDKKGVASAQVVQAGILPNPVFSSSADFPYSSPTPGNVDAYLFDFTWNPIALLTLRDQIEGAQANESSVELAVAWQEWQVAEKAKQQVYRLVLLQKELDTAKVGEDKLRINRDSIQKAMDQGNKTIIDLSAVQASLDTIHLSVLSIEQNLELERLILNETLGFPPDYPIKISSHIQVPDFHSIPSLDDVFSGIENRRFDLVALKMGYESQEANLRVAIINQIPAINLGPSISRDNTDVKMKGCLLSMELPFFNRNQGIIAIAEATRKQLFDEYISRIFTARAQIATILANLEYLKYQIEFTQVTINALTELNQVYHQALLEGNADVLTYYNSINNLILKQIDLLKLQRLYVDQYIALEIAAGEFLTDEDEELE